jgi:hypothetical protein
MEKVKDTTASELQYLFLYKMSIFEKKFHESKINAYVYNDDERPSHLSMLADKVISPSGFSEVNQVPSYVNQHHLSYATVTEYDDFDTELLNGLSESKKIIVA